MSRRVTRGAFFAIASAVVFALVAAQDIAPAGAHATTAPQHQAVLTSRTTLPRSITRLLNPHFAPPTGAFGSNYSYTSLTDSSYGFSGSLAEIFDGSDIWTANTSGNSLTEIDASTGALVRVVSGANYKFNHPWSLALSGGYLWVANPDGNSVTEVNPADGSLVRVLSGTAYGFNAPRGVAGRLGHVWVANEFGNTLTELKASDGSVIKTLSAGTYGFSHPNTLFDDGKDVWVTNNTGGSVTEFNSIDGSLVRVISGGNYGFTQLSGVTEVNGHVWVSSWSLSSPSVTELNVSDGSFVQRVAMPAARPIGVVGFDGYIWVALWEGSALVQLNESDGSIVHTFAAGEGNFSYPQGITTDGNRIWVLNAGNASMTVITDPPSPARPDVMAQRDDGAAGNYVEMVSADISTNGLPTTYRSEWGTDYGRYDHIGPPEPSGGVLTSSAPTRVISYLHNLPFGQVIHWRIVATNGRGTHYGVDQTAMWIKFYGVGPIVCVKHLQWQLITADIIGPGCWVGHFPRVPQNQTLAIPPPAPFNPGSACLVLAGPCPPPKSPPPTPPLYVSGGQMAQIPPASGPIMAAIPEQAGKDVTVELNGMLVTSAYVVADQPRQFLMASNANLDLAGSADGTVPPTPIARKVSFTQAIPSNYGPVYTGLPLARHVNGLGPATSNPPSCTDPLVANAPLMGDFPDPSGIGAALGDLNLGGSGDPVAVHLINSRVVVCVNINLPLGPCASASSSAGIQATLLADQSGLTLQDLYAHLDCAIVAGVVFSDVSFSFDGNTKRWQAQGTVEAIPGLQLQGVVSFSHGEFEHAGAAAKPSALTFGFLRLKSVGFDVYPDKTTGTVEFGSIFNVPYITGDPLSISGGYELNWGANPEYFEVNGNVAVFGDPLFTGDIKLFDDGTATGIAHFKAGISGVFSAEADVQADYWSTSPLRFNVDGNASVSVFDFINVSGEVVASDNGAGVCIDGSDLKLGHFGLVVHSDGSVDKWLPVAGGCDISGARDVRPATQIGHVHGRAASTSLQVVVDPGAQGVFFGVQGNGGVPAFALDGPNGEHYDVAATGAINDSTHVVFHDTTNDITYVGVPTPSAGTWTATAASGSVELTELRTGTVQPPAAVTATVTHTGGTYHLNYTGPVVAGQSVQFIERGAGDVAALGTATGGGTGSLTFVPPDGAATQRTIVAIVTQDGVLRSEVNAGTYTAPAPTIPGAVTKLRAARKGTSITATWSAVAGARDYITVVHTSSGASRVLFGAKPSVTLTGVSAANAVRIRVQAVNGKLRGPTASTSVTALKIGLKSLRVSPSPVGSKATSVRVKVTTSLSSAVTVRLVGPKGNTVETVKVHAAAGTTGVTVPLLLKGKRITTGQYAVAVTAQAKGLRTEGAAIALKVK